MLTTVGQNKEIILKKVFYLEYAVLLQLGEIPYKCLLCAGDG